MQPEETRGDLRRENNLQFPCDSSVSSSKIRSLTIYIHCEGDVDRKHHEPITFVATTTVHRIPLYVHHTAMRRATCSPCCKRVCAISRGGRQQYLAASSV
jgi:hypothetical protein